MKETADLYGYPGRASLKDKKFMKGKYPKSKRSKTCRHDTFVLLSARKAGIAKLR